MSWTTYYMGLGPSDKLQYTLHVTPFNVTQLIDTAPPSQACPLLAWAAYWTLRTHGIPTDRQLRLEAACDGMLRAEYGDAGAALIKDSGLMDNPMRLVINSKWDDLVDGWWNKPKAPMLAVPLNMTAGYAVWRSMDAALKWTNEWAPKHIPVLKKGRRSSQRRRRRGRRLFGG
ncbi:hypothetical protein MNEG_11123 [Monoraphidium neglectum]|uniref:Uncharacterized protein n=1 Tax=Monoraphidium neglectum TaxID=145388 RepID=A0A0D2LZL2_9CHLO|nr:hypothetical protein MNEG_11123 [Monoraphidium neglectum]KIY96839.1 hypothetical protein MNEG_11123 [Monoraphidium neglectum]|eukprot:XP_013895859.1 hypothetical protein MNEG_11123 [Monoraphidium neglectum]